MHCQSSWRGVACPPQCKEHGVTRWTAAITYLDEEYRAAHHVERIGFRYYLPTALLPDKTGMLRLHRLMFPRYIFIKLKSSWIDLIGLPGIWRLFLQNERPIPVPESDIALLRLIECEVSAESARLPERRVQAGMRVRVRDGLSMAGKVCSVSVLKERGKCEVLLSIMGRNVRTVLHEDALDVLA